MSEASLHHSISAACEYSGNDQIFIIIIIISSLLSIIFLAFCFLFQGSRVHMEQVKPAEKWSSEFSHAAGAGI